jgi:malyl-CoA/(S)-citramalyl-CoA lyase
VHHSSSAFYRSFGDISDQLGCEDQFRAAFLLDCVGAWSLHPNQITIARKVFSPPVDDGLFAKKVVLVTLAQMLAKKDPDLARAYGFA